MKPWKLLIALLSPTLAAPPLPAEIIERVVAKGNGQITTLSDFTARQISEAQAARVSPDRIEQFLRDNNARILQSAIDDLLIVQKAADIGLRVPPAYLKDVIENIKKENNIESDEAFLQQLARRHVARRPEAQHRALDPLAPGGHARGRLEDPARRRRAARRIRVEEGRVHDTRQAAPAGDRAQGRPARGVAAGRADRAARSRGRGLLGAGARAFERALA